MTKAELKRITDAAWNAAHPPDITAAKHTAAIKEHDTVVFKRFMARAAADKQARCAVLASHSLEGLANTLDRWNATIGKYQMLG